MIPNNEIGNYEKGTFYYNVTINFRKCKIGEIYIKND